MKIERTDTKNGNVLNNKNPKVCFSFGFSQHNGKLFTMPSKNSIKVIRIYSHPQGVN